MNYALTTVKILFHIFNLIFMLIGNFLIGYAIYGLIMRNEFPFYYNVIGIGMGIVMVLGFTLGYFGMKQESFGLMAFNIIVVGVMFIIIFIALCRLYSAEIERPLTSLAEDAWAQHELKPNEMVELEKKYLCCGLHGRMDYLDKFEAVPSSCYPNKRTNDIGCWERLRDIARLGVQGLTITYWIYVIFDGCLLAFGIIMAQHFRHMRRTPKIFNERI